MRNFSTTAFCVNLFKTVTTNPQLDILQWLERYLTIPKFLGDCAFPFPRNRNATHNKYFIRFELQMMLKPGLVPFSRPPSQAVWPVGRTRDATLRNFPASTLATEILGSRRSTSKTISHAQISSEESIHLFIVYITYTVEGELGVTSFLVNYF